MAYDYAREYEKYSAGDKAVRSPMNNWERDFPGGHRPPASAPGTSQIDDFARKYPNPSQWVTADTAAQRGAARTTEDMAAAAERERGLAAQREAYTQRVFGGHNAEQVARVGRDMGTPDRPLYSPDELRRMDGLMTQRDTSRGLMRGFNDQLGAMNTTLDSARAFGANAAGRGANAPTEWSPPKNAFGVSRNIPTADVADFTSLLGEVRGDTANDWMRAFDTAEQAQRDLLNMRRSETGDGRLGSAPRTQYGSLGNPIERSGSALADSMPERSLGQDAAERLLHAQRQSVNADIERQGGKAQPSQLDELKRIDDDLAKLVPSDTASVAEREANANRRRVDPTPTERVIGLADDYLNAGRQALGDGLKSLGNAVDVDAASTNFEGLAKDLFAVGSRSGADIKTGAEHYLTQIRNGATPERAREAVQQGWAAAKQAGVEFGEWLKGAADAIAPKPSAAPEAPKPGIVRDSATPGVTPEKPTTWQGMKDAARNLYGLAAGRTRSALNAANETLGPAAADALAEGAQGPKVSAQEAIDRQKARDKDAKKAAADEYARNRDINSKSPQEAADFLAKNTDLIDADRVAYETRAKGGVLDVGTPTSMPGKAWDQAKFGIKGAGGLLAAIDAVDIGARLGRNISEKGVVEGTKQMGREMGQGLKQGLKDAAEVYQAEDLPTALASGASALGSGVLKAASGASKGIEAKLASSPNIGIGGALRRLQFDDRPVSPDIFGLDAAAAPKPYHEIYDARQAQPDIFGLDAIAAKMDKTRNDVFEAAKAGPQPPPVDTRGRVETADGPRFFATPADAARAAPLIAADAAKTKADAAKQRDTAKTQAAREPEQLGPLPEGLQRFTPMRWVENPNTGVYTDTSKETPEYRKWVEKRTKEIEASGKRVWTAADTQEQFSRQEEIDRRRAAAQSTPEARLSYITQQLRNGDMKPTDAAALMTAEANLALRGGAGLAKNVGAQQEKSREEAVRLSEAFLNKDNTPAAIAKREAAALMLDARIKANPRDPLANQIGSMIMAQHQGSGAGPLDDAVQTGGRSLFTWWDPEAVQPIRSGSMQPQRVKGATHENPWFGPPGVYGDDTGMIYEDDPKTPATNSFIRDAVNAWGAEGAAPPPPPQPDLSWQDAAGLSQEQIAQALAQARSAAQRNGLRQRRVQEMLSGMRANA